MEQREHNIQDIEVKIEELGNSSVAGVTASTGMWSGSSEYRGE